MDYEVERCTRHCAASGRELDEGEEFFSVLRAEKGGVHRHDYATEAWTGPPEGTFAWWKSRMPTREAKRGQLAPNEVLLSLFYELEQAAGRDMRYVLALLLVRRRVLREEEIEHDDQGGSLLVLYCPRDESTHRVPVVTPDERRTEEIQAELSRLLFAEAVG